MKIFHFTFQKNIYGASESRPRLRTERGNVGNKWSRGMNEVLAKAHEDDLGSTIYDLEVRDLRKCF